MARKRTAKACGPDASRPVSSFAELSARRRCQQSLIAGESTYSLLKPLRGECRVFSAESVVTTLVCFFILRTRLRAQQAPGIPCALCYQRVRRFQQTSGGARRENADDCLNVIARSNATKQSILSSRRAMDCFACARNDVDRVR